MSSCQRNAAATDKNGGHSCANVPVARMSKGVPVYRHGLVRLKRVRSFEAACNPSSSEEGTALVTLGASAAHHKKKNNQDANAFIAVQKVMQATEKNSTQVESWPEASIEGNGGEEGYMHYTFRIRRAFFKS